MMATTKAQEAVCSVVKVETLKLETKDGRKSKYNGVVVTEDTLLVIDFHACNLQFYSRRDGKLLSTSHRLEDIPTAVCLISKTEAAVCLWKSTIVIMSFKSIDDVKRVKIFDVMTGFSVCHSVAKLKSRNKLVVSGRKHDDMMLYWCVVNLKDGRLHSTHSICKGDIGSGSHLAIKDNNVYISCWTSDSTFRGVYAYDIFNSHTKKFLYQHHRLSPGSIMVDRRNFIYVCDRYSKRIHQLTDSGQLVTIHTVSSFLYEIFYDDQQGVLYTTQSNEITMYRMDYLHQPGIPMEILMMDDRSIQLFKEALKDGMETVHNIRIMVVGHMGVGKTTLVKRLLGEKVNISERCSTEGIDVYVNCCDVSLSTNEWTRRPKDSEQDYQLQRLARVLNEQQSVKDKVTDEEQVRIPPQGKGTVKNYEETRVAVEDTDTKLINRSSAKVLYRRSPQGEFGPDLSSTASQLDKFYLDLAEKKLPQPETSTVAMLKLLQENAYKLKQDKGKTSPLTVWDFAGQFAFYTTHQTFFTRRAIYLLVSDISEQLTDLVADEYYFDSDGIMKCKVHELIEVWMNFIHSCASFPKDSIPPVILVGTHVDKISQKKSVSKQRESWTQGTMSKREEFTLPVTYKKADTITKEKPRTSNFLGSVQEATRIVDASPDFSMAGAHAFPTMDQPKSQRKLSFWQRILDKTGMRADTKKRYRHEICERYFRAIRTCLSDKPTRFHLVDEDFAIDNTVVDSRLDDLKRKIVEVASQQSYWGEQIPARWLPLEQELMKLKAAGIKVIPRRMLEDLNEAGAVPLATDELDLFLRFQHDIGIILYFSMDVLREKVVLDPQWLIDALKSLITADEMFILRNTKAVTDKWLAFKTEGKLTPDLIDAIWTKKQDFHSNKEHLLLLMEKLNIISQPKSYSEDVKKIVLEDYYLAPCMLRQAVPMEIISPESNPEMEGTSVLCFTCTEKVLPPPIFHRLVGACLTHWPIAKQKSENLIYCGCCVFDLDNHHRLILHFRDYVIFAQVRQMGVTDTTRSFKLCSKARMFIFENLSKITENLGQSLKFEMHIKCPNSNINIMDGLIEVSLLQMNDKVVCNFHAKSHTLVSRQLLQYWFQQEGSQKQEERDTGVNRNKAGLMKSVTDQTEAVFIHDQLVQQAKSVGKISSPSVCGTGFRVGPCYIMTAKHIVDKIMKAAAVPPGQHIENRRYHPLNNTNVFIDFSYEMDKQTIDENLIFHFEPRIVYANDELDTAILQLKHYTTKRYPPPLTKFIKPLMHESQGYFIGHSKGQIKKTDKYQCFTLNPEHIYAVKAWSMEHVNVDGFIGIEDSRRVLLHCSFEGGASGSPGFWINPGDGQAYVLLMLLRGYPDWYYDENYKDKIIGMSHSDLIEQGVYMTSIYDNMIKTEPLLCQEIFPSDAVDEEMTCL